MINMSDTMFFCLFVCLFLKGAAILQTVPRTMPALRMVNNLGQLVKTLHV